jgi:hypothetical protein
VPRGHIHSFHVEIADWSLVSLRHRHTASV